MSKTKKKKLRNEVRDASPASSRKKWPITLVILGICIITYKVFSPGLNNGFTNWDDPDYVLDNPQVVSKVVPVKEIFSSTVSANYHPVTILSLSLNYQLSKLNAEGYHATDLLFHILNSVLVFLFIWLLSGRRIVVATISSVLFAIHPMHAESVYWISARKDVLYVCFLLLGLICYLRYLEKRGVLSYVSTVLLFILACLSKPMAVIFPVILLLIDYYKGQRISWKSVLEKTPFFLVAISAGVIAIITQAGTAISTNNEFSFVQHLLFASHSLLVYLYKFFIPSNLSSYYAYPSLSPSGYLPLIYYFSPWILLAIAGLIVILLRNQKAFMFGALFFALSLMMVLQLVSVGTAIMAERYTYLAYVGLGFIVGYYCDDILNKRGVSIKYAISGLGVFTILAFSYATASRAKVWNTSETLWTDVIEKNNGSVHNDAAYVNRGRFYKEIGNVDKALADYRAALKLNPMYTYALNNLANIQKDQGEIDSAIINYSKVIAQEPSHFLAYANRALTYKIRGNKQAALEDFGKSIALNPIYWANYYNRGMFYYELNEPQKAIDDFSMGISIKYDDAQLYFKRGLAFSKLKNHKRAIEDFTSAIKINAKVAEFWLYRALSESDLGMQTQSQADILVSRRLMGLDS